MLNQLGMELFSQLTQVVEALPLDGIFGAIRDNIGAPGLVTLVILGWVFN